MRLICRQENPKMTKKGPHFDIYEKINTYFRLKNMKYRAVDLYFQNFNQNSKICIITMFITRRKRKLYVDVHHVDNVYQICNLHFPS